jgi:hypothetical protein
MHWSIYTMEPFLGFIGITFLGGALFRWLRHRTWRITLFVIIFLAFARTAIRTSPVRDTQAGLFVMAGLIILPLVGAYLIGVVMRSRLARAIKGGAILLSKNVDALAEVAEQHGDASPRK